MPDIRDIVRERLEPEDLALLLENPHTYLRDEQRRPPDAKRVCQVKAGRGFGKTFMGSHHTLDILEDWGDKCEGIIGSKTIGDTFRDMIHGRSGLVRCARFRGYELEIKLEGDKHYLLHPAGGKLWITSGEIPDGARGLNLNYAWLDELEHWRAAELAWMNIEMACRVSGPPPGNHKLITSTPNYLSPVRFDDRNDVTVIRGAMLDNIANLDEADVQAKIKAWEGHPLGRQELEGFDIQLEGVVATLEQIHTTRIAPGTAPELDSIIMGIDPGSFGSDPSKNDPTGVVVVGKAGADFYVLSAFEHRGDSLEWNRLAAEEYARLTCGQAVVETNQGGIPMLNTLSRTAAAMGINMVVVPYQSTLSKLDRALGTMQQYRLGHMHHVGVHKQLEGELSTWGPRAGRASPNLLDALVHAMNAHLETTTMRDFDAEIRGASGADPAGPYIPASILGLT